MIAEQIFAPKNSSLEEIYLREGMRQIDGKIYLVHMAHRDTTCDYCESPLSNERRHPLVATDDIHEVCGGYFVHLVE